MKPLNIESNDVESPVSSTEASNKNEGVNNALGKKVVFGTIASVGAVLLGYYLKSFFGKKGNEAEVSQASSPLIFPMAGGGVTTSYLYLLGDDPIEFYNRYGDAGYTALTDAITQNATNMLSIYGVPTIPDLTNQIAAYTAAGGVTPWITSSNTARTITQKYSYSSAPHIVFFLVDDWGYNDVGYQSTYLNWTTPNIDKLAYSGIRFTNYFTHELCTPSRAALMTGRYASRFGMNGDSTNELNLPLSEVTMAEEMHSAGYRSYLVGKWHLGRSEWAYTPTYRGFDYFYGFLGSQIDYWDKTNGGWLDLQEGTSLVTDADELSSSVHSAYLYEKKAEAIIASHATNYPDTPMFLYYSSQLIHDTWEAPQHFISRCVGGTTDEQTYCGMNLMLDEVVGNLTCALKSNGMFENTLFVLVSDNGGANTMSGSSVPWRGGKGSLWRGGTSAAGFMYGSTNIIPASQQGTTYDGLMHVTDWLPTLMSVATNGGWTGGYTNNSMDGVNNFNNIITNSASSRHEILHFLNAAGNMSYQYDSNKGIINTIKTAPFKTPNHYFAGDKSETVNYCSFMSEMSAVPHLSPTLAPALAFAPTPVPTTIAPTKKPKPTAYPSVAPTAPTFGPTGHPVVVTSVPTVIPTILPTYVATDGPTAAPTIAPTAISTDAPSVIPSTVPSYASTDGPTAVPTIVSTTVPSAVPSKTPTEGPTGVPVFAPTPVPTRRPTRKPSVKPKPTALSV